MAEHTGYHVVIREREDYYNERSSTDKVIMKNFATLEAAKSMATLIAPHLDRNDEVIVEEPVVRTYVSYKQVDWQ